MTGGGTFRGVPRYLSRGNQAGINGSARHTSHHAQLASGAQCPTQRKVMAVVGMDAHEDRAKIRSELAQSESVVKDLVRRFEVLPARHRRCTKGFSPRKIKSVVDTFRGPATLTSSRSAARPICCVHLITFDHLLPPSQVLIEQATIEAESSRLSTSRSGRHSPDSFSPLSKPAMRALSPIPYPGRWPGAASPSPVKLSPALVKLSLSPSPVKLSTPMKLSDRDRAVKRIQVRRPARVAESFCSQEQCDRPPVAT